MAEEGSLTFNRSRTYEDLRVESERVVTMERLADEALLVGQMVKMTKLDLVEVLDRYSPWHWKQRQSC